MDALHRPRAILAILLSGVMAVALTTSALASAEGQAAADEVTEASYRYFLGDDQGVPGILFTHAGDSRGLGDPQHDLAQANIVAEFQSFGLVVTLEPFSYFGDTYYNIVATQTGTLAADQEYVIGAHYDSTCFCSNAPGADDDASGVATVLEAARIISQYESDYTIRFLCFDREEQGLIGSNEYVASHSGDDILGMVQCDMMAWDPGTNTASIWGRDNPALPLKNALSQAITLYSEYQGISLTPIDQGWNGQSDHAPFDAAGYQACMFIEGEGFNNGSIHSTADNVENPGYINYPFATRMTKSVVGWLVDAAGVHLDGLVFSYPSGRPPTVSPQGGTAMRVEVSGIGITTPQPGTGVFHYDIGGGWQSEPMAVISSNVYDAVFPATDCGQEIKYYVSAEDTDTNVFTSPANAPTTSFSAAAIEGLTEDVVFEANLDVSPGWTIEGQWAFGEPAGGGGTAHGGPDPRVDQVHTGSNVYGYDLAGDYPNDLPETHLTSTAIDCTDMHGVHLRFWRWLGVEQPLYDHAYVRASNNGTDWTTVWQNAAEITDSSWQEMDLDISAVADDQPTVYLRWTMGATDVGWRYCGWNIDDITLTAVDCSVQCPGADGDMNGIDGTNGDDIQHFASALLGTPTQYETCHGDFDGLNGLDVNDIPGLVAKLLE